MVNGRIKGANAERELADMLTTWAKSVGVTLVLSRNLEQVRGGGYDLTGLEDYNLAVECKRCETLTVAAWWRQAVRQADKKTPVLAWRQNRTPWRFKIRAWVYPCNKPVDIELDTDGFKDWFLAVIAKR